MWQYVRTSAVLLTQQSHALFLLTFSQPSLKNKGTSRKLVVNSCSTSKKNFSPLIQQVHLPTLFLECEAKNIVIERERQRETDEAQSSCMTSFYFHAHNGDCRESSFRFSLPVFKLNCLLI